ncbi:MAG: endonuclease/exonuclease/phosphatase family protein, partial [Bacteroidota bacterium]
TGYGSLAWREHWNLFDHMIVSSELRQEDYSESRVFRAGVGVRPYLVNPSGTYKGYPYRSFSNGRSTGGFSDHFPVYLFLIKRIEGPSTPY